MAHVLKQLELSGFKSFGSRTKIDFSGGLVAIVGPNGSGKSNVVDAIRWALGEQSTKLLRLNKSEELIFAGTKNKAKASMAEAVLLLDNATGRLPIDAAEVQLSRRLYRSGDSEYLLNGQVIKLKQLQELLAQAGFGQNSYAVVGQGMVDRLLLSSPIERKTLFEEASGTRHFELQRTNYMRKLDQTKDNLTQLKQLIAELSPQVERAKNLAKQQKEHNLLLDKLDQAKRDYLLTQIFENRHSLDKITAHAVKEQSELSSTQSRLQDLQKKRKDIQAEFRANQVGREKLMSTLTDLTTRRSKLAESLAVLRAQEEVQNKLVAQVVDLDSLRQAIKATERKLHLVQKKSAETAEKISNFDTKIAHVQKALDELNQSLAKIRKQLQHSSKSIYLNHALGLLNLLAHKDNIVAMNKKDRDLAFHKLRRMLKLVLDDKSEEAAQEVSRLQAKITRQMAIREDLIEERNTFIIRLRSYELDTASLQEQLAQDEQRLELDSAASSLDSSESGNQNRKQQLKQAAKELVAIDKQIASLQLEMTKSVGDHLNTESIDASIEELAGRVAMGSEKAQILKEEQDRVAVVLRDLELSFETTYGSPIPQKPPRSVSEKDVVIIEAKLAALCANSQEDARQQLEELSSRLAELKTQEQDLETAMKDLNSLISTTEQDIRKKFHDGFTSINRQFGHFFQELFGGGSAEIALVATENGEYGIEFNVTPPGKRQQQLAMLSGGERSLGAIALLAAIIAVNPSPFMVLDEVDAALDDANAAKFSNLLGELKKKTQLIVVTHNHTTMHASDQLTGITTDSDGVAMAVSGKMVAEVAQEA